MGFAGELALRLGARRGCAGREVAPLLTPPFPIPPSPPHPISDPRVPPPIVKQALCDSVKGEGALDDETAVRSVACFDHEEVRAGGAR